MAMYLHTGVCVHFLGPVGGKAIAAHSLPATEMILEGKERIELMLLPQTGFSGFGQ